ncbi:hypothetical protein JX265_009789 [Neoarthrinium moseri]|uniref:Succinylglutamate desuccinylase/Aspartoacylase catalytic domain-containing protein n=1 Tax=Neoarthrinium moseri TaxID=1658444 RepID=A0A9Q0ALE9_9PEZI|nr:uncharacterized protein JN550_013502 [Neoarthrinium moseri]KAI1857009.1 hypothetical protein JN550_013502 [Neoarthrinium moseri]KAI1861170.1 hypothetical protein JX265_009789 [Neoarthrinium moseri]
MHLKPLITTAFLATTSLAITDRTGDVLNGAEVINSLDLNDVPSSAVTRYYLRAGELNGGFPLHLPIFIARGPKETLETGKKLSVSGTVHGDELNPIRVVQKVFENLEINIDKLNGTVIGVPGINPMGIYLNQRNFWTASDSGFLTNINRVFPGTNSSSGGNGGNVIAYNLWNYIWGNTSNVDVAIDLHTPSSGSGSSLWCYADFRLPYVERLAKLLQPNILKIDPGEPGSIETTFVRHGVPAITVEMGIAKTWLPDLIDRTYDFVIRVMDDLSMLSGNSSTQHEPDLSKTFIGNTFQGVRSTYGGFIESLVTWDQDVKAGQELGRIRNVWGDVIQILRAPVDARIHQAPIDPSVEPGQDVFSLVYNSTDPSCIDGCVL